MDDLTDLEQVNIIISDMNLRIIKLAAKLEADGFPAGVIATGLLSSGIKLYDMLYPNLDEEDKKEFADAAEIIVRDAKEKLIAILNNDQEVH